MSSRRRKRTRPNDRSKACGTLKKLGEIGPGSVAETEAAAVGVFGRAVVGEGVRQARHGVGRPLGRRLLFGGGCDQEATLQRLLVAEARSELLLVGGGAGGRGGDGQGVAWRWK